MEHKNNNNNSHRIMSTTYQSSAPAGLVDDEPLPTPPEAPGWSQERAKKRLYTAFFIVLISVAAFAAVCGAHNSAQLGFWA